MALPPVLGDVTQSMGLVDEFAIVLAFAFAGGFVATRLKLPPVVGYIAAGLIVGPFTPGWVANTAFAEQMGQIGIVVLMFGVGLHFSVRDLLNVKNVAIPGAIIQSLLTTLLCIGAAYAFGWGFGGGLVLGLGLSVASTIVLVRALMARDALDTAEGRIAVGWLIVEDMFSVLVLVLLPIAAVSLGGSPDNGHAVAETWLGALHHEGDSLLNFALRSIGLGQGALQVTIVALTNVVLLAGFVLFLGTALSMRLLDAIERTGSEELFTLAVLVSALFLAVGAEMVFGLSEALGAFLGGVMLGRYRLKHRVAEDIRPIRDIFGIIFFAAVGMLLNPQTLVDAPLQLLLVVIIIMVAKPLIAAVILKVLKQPRGTMAVISPALGQVGEFSFILAVMGRSLNLLPDLGYQLIIAGSVISIGLNPLLFTLAERITGAVAATGPRSGVAEPAVGEQSNV